MPDRSEVKESLIRLVVEASSQNGVLDPEDREMLVKFHMGKITSAELDAFATAKAKRIIDQMDNPQ